MTKKMFYFLTIVCLIILSGFSNCGKQANTPEEKATIAQELIQKLNIVPLGIAFNVDPSNISVETTDSNQYLITFKQTTTLLNTSVFKKLNINVPFNDEEVTIKTDELTYKYGPQDNYLELIDMNGLSAQWDLSKASTTINDNQREEKPEQMSIRFYLGKSTFHGYNLSPVLTSQSQTILELFGAMMRNAINLKFQAENFSYAIQTQEKEKDMSFEITIDKMEGSETVLPEVFLSLYIKDQNIPKLSDILKQGKPLLDLATKLSSLKVTIKTDGDLTGEGIAENIEFSYFLKPDANKAFFKYGFNWDMKNLKLSIPGKKDIETAGNIEHMNMKFSMENFSTSFVESYINLIRKSMEASATMDQEKIKQQQIMMGMTIATEFMKSQPEIKCSFTPFKHKLGELDADMEFKFFNLMSPPVGKAIVKFPKINDTLSNIKTLLSGPITETLVNLASEYIIIDPQGNGQMIFETKQDQPGKFFLNGKAINK